MARPERSITPEEVRAVMGSGGLIEDYPEDARGHSCLLVGEGKDSRPVHVVCAPKEDFLVIITAYIPSEDEWESDFRTRKTR